MHHVYWSLRLSQVGAPPIVPMGGLNCKILTVFCKFLHEITHRTGKEGFLKRLSLRDWEPVGLHGAPRTGPCFTEQESMQQTRSRTEMTGDIDCMKWKIVGHWLGYWVFLFSVLFSLFVPSFFFHFQIGVSDERRSSAFLTKLSTWRCVVTNWVETCSGTLMRWHGSSFASETFETWVERSIQHWP